MLLDLFRFVFERVSGSDLGVVVEVGIFFPPANLGFFFFEFRYRASGCVFLCTHSSVARGEFFLFSPRRSFGSFYVTLGTAFL